MTIQEKIEILAGVSNHPNKEFLVFKIDNLNWVGYNELKRQVSENTNEFYWDTSSPNNEDFTIVEDEIIKPIYIEQDHDLDIDVEVYKRLKNMEFISIDIKDIEDELNGDIEKAIVESFNKNK